MSQEKVSYTKSSSKFMPVSQRRTTVIQRNSTPTVFGAGGRMSMSSSRMSYSSGGGGGLSFKAGTLGKISNDGVSQVMDTREKEKKEMQSLNERFASYIEKVRFLEAQNKQLLDEVDRLKRAKGFDVSKIKEMYEAELEQAKTVIDEMGKEKSEFDAKMVGLQDALESEQSYRVDAERDAADQRAKLDKLNNTMGDYVGELSTLRGRIESQDDEIQRLRDLLDKLKNDNKRLRADLDTECAAHIAEANRAQTLEEQCEFNAQVSAEEIAQLKGLLDQDKTTEIRDYWKGQLSKCIREIQGEYDRQLDVMREDMQMRMDMQMRELQSGAQRDAPDTGFVKEQSRQLRTKMNEQGGRLAELESQNASLRAQLASMMEQNEELSRELDQERRERSEEVGNLQAEIEAMIAELRILGDAKLTLELEINCYRKLLEGEEQSLQSMMASSVGARSKGGSALADMVQQSSLAESTGKLTVQRSAKGFCAFLEASPDGRYVIIENTSSSKSGREKVQNLRNWKIVRKAGSERAEHVFDKDFVLKPEQQLKIWSKGNQNSRRGEDQVSDCFSWFSGSGTYQLLDASGDEKAALTIKFTQ